MLWDQPWWAIYIAAFVHGYAFCRITRRRR